MARPEVALALTLVLFIQVSWVFPQVNVNYPGGSVDVPNRGELGGNVNVNYPGGFVNVPSRGQPGSVQVAYPGGFVNVPSRLTSFLNNIGRPAGQRYSGYQGGFVAFPGGSVNFGK